MKQLQQTKKEGTEQIRSRDETKVRRMQARATAALSFFFSIHDSGAGAGKNRMDWLAGCLL